MKTRTRFRFLEKSFLLGLVLLFGLLFFETSKAEAFFTDDEIIGSNGFENGVLEFSLSEDTDFVDDIEPSVEPFKNISLVKSGNSLDFKYKVLVENLSSSDLCGGIEIKDDLAGSSYATLSSYESVVVDIDSKTDWQFDLRLSEDDFSLENKNCVFDLVFEAWQSDLDYGEGGFVDSKTLSNDIGSGDWENIADHLVINEVYYDVASDKGDEGTNEWVELYNPSSSTVNLKDWEICDNTDCDVLSDVDLDISAYGYAVITNDITTWEFWSVPGSPTLKIELGSDIGGGLSNSGDQVYIKNSSGIVVDAMSYGDDDSVLDPACPGISEGESLTRKPAGQDSDQASDFEVLTSPNPGTNPHTVVMNEIMPNPEGNDSASSPAGEWIELYNYGEYEVNLVGWKFENQKKEILEIEESKINSGEKLVIYRDGKTDFSLDDDGDEIKLIDETGKIKDVVEYEVVPENKTIARFPDAVGPWIDPEGTPGKSNKMSSLEKVEQVILVLDKCFDEDYKLEEENNEAVCQVEYLKYLGVLEEIDDEEVSKELIDKLKLEVKEETEIEKETEEENKEIIEDEKDSDDKEKKEIDEVNLLEMEDVEESDEDLEEIVFEEQPVNEDQAGIEILLEEEVEIVDEVVEVEKENSTQIDNSKEEKDVREETKNEEDQEESKKEAELKAKRENEEEKKKDEVKEEDDKVKEEDKEEIKEEEEIEQKNTNDEEEDSSSKKKEKEEDKKKKDQAKKEEDEDNSESEDDLNRDFQK